MHKYLRGISTILTLFFFRFKGRHIGLERVRYTRSPANENQPHNQHENWQHDLLIQVSINYTSHNYLLIVFNSVVYSQ